MGKPTHYPKGLHPPPPPGLHGFFNQKEKLLVSELADDAAVLDEVSP